MESAMVNEQTVIGTEMADEPEAEAEERHGMYISGFALISFLVDTEVKPS